MSSLAVIASILTPGSAATAMRPFDATGTQAKAGLNCPAGLVGLGADRRMHYYSINNGRVQRITKSSNRLSYRATAWGFYDSSTTKKKRVLRLNTVAKNGVPRLVTATFTSNRITLSSKNYRQRGFKPDQFADGYTYYAYTIAGSKLLRWTLTRFANGSIRFAKRTTLGSGFGKVTSLQTSSVYKIKGASKEVLYATTADGGLLQIAVPLKNPTRAKVKTLATTGYAGVSEMAWSICNKDDTHHYLIAVDRAAGSATWTTISQATTKPEATLHGKVKRGKKWDLVAAF
ncbi:hypothetical protein [Nocardioides sp.]|uniref:hypothetical protein n=1 Tax=Nocardioides sp. TaxID=35761 RepID=UPI003566697F